MPSEEITKAILNARAAMSSDYNAQVITLGHLNATIDTEIAQAVQEERDRLRGVLDGILDAPTTNQEGESE